MSEAESNILERLSKGECVYQKDARSFLYIPLDTLNKVGGRDGIRTIHKLMFEGSNPLWANLSDNCYQVEMPSSVTDEQVQNFIKKINEAK